jgi:hypothetical protein
MRDAPYDSWYHLAGRDPSPLPLRYYLCFKNEVTVSWDADKLVDLVKVAYPQVRRIRVTGEHSCMDWAADSMLVIDDELKVSNTKIVAYIWKERHE